MIQSQVLPAARKAETEAAENVIKVRQVAGEKGAQGEEAFFAKLHGHINSLQMAVQTLEENIEKTRKVNDALNQARAARDTLLPVMTLCREHSDALERIVDDSLWNLPKYSELLWIH